jgi:hypothetical protein
VEFLAKTVLVVAIIIGLSDALSTCLNRYSSAAEHVATQGALPATTSTQWILYSINTALKHLDLLLERGPKLVKELEAIRNEKAD